MTTAARPLTGVTDLADAVLFEGYMLYPYRADDPKNRVRWQFGVLAPPGFVAIDPSERAGLQTECLLEGAAMRVSVRVRFLHVQHRLVERAVAGEFVPTEALDLGDATYLPWDEAVVHDTTHAFDIPAQAAHRDATTLHASAHSATEILRAADGSVAGQLLRTRSSLDAQLTLAVEPLVGPYGVRRLRLRLENTTPWTPSGLSTPDRPEALRRALVAAHLVICVEGGSFLSLIDPPEWAKGYVELCEQVGTFPVLAGPAGDHSLVLASPIILYDHPEVAPESASQFCDATEMDEMLTLRTLTLTDAEKRLVRGSDPRAAALVDEIDNLPPELMDRLHGAIRSMTSVARPVGLPAPPKPQDPGEVLPWMNAEVDGRFDPDTDVVVVAGVPVSKGSAVRLRPGARRADAQDMFLEGRTATVEAVLSDLDGAQHLAVSLDDLAEHGVNPHGRFLYFAPDEVEPLGGGR